MIANGKATKCPICNTDVERFVRVFMDVPCDSKGDDVDRLQTEESKCGAELEQVVREMKKEMSILQKHLNRFHKEALSQLSQMDLELQGIAAVSSDEVCKNDEDIICKLQERLRQFHEEALSQLEGDRVSFW
jgi:hypothetical protein